MRKPARDKLGRFRSIRGAYIDEKGYLVISAGPFRGVRLHRILAAFKLGRPLTKDEDVHHRNGSKLDFGYDNIQVLGHKEHGAVSARQHWYIKQNDIQLKNEWEQFFEAEAGGGQC